MNLPSLLPSRALFQQLYIIVRFSFKSKRVSFKNKRERSVNSRLRKTWAASEAEDLARVTTEEENQCESNPWITGFKSSATGLKFALWLARVGKLEELPAMEKAAPKSHREAAIRTVYRAMGKQERKLDALNQYSKNLCRHQLEVKNY